MQALAASIAALGILHYPVAEPATGPQGETLTAHSKARKFKMLPIRMKYLSGYSYTN